MKDIYQRALEQPGYARGKSLPSEFLSVVRQQIRAEGMFADTSEELCVMQGLARVTAHPLELTFDVPNFGRTRVSNAEPQVTFLVTPV